MIKSSFHALSVSYHSAINFLSYHKTYTAFSFIMLSSIVVYGLYSAPKNESSTYVVSRGTLTQYVKVTGQVESSKNADLSFQTSGAVTYIGVATGDKVTQGKLLATISGSDAQSSLLAAEANLEREEANLAQLTQGTRKEELALKEQALTNANNTLDQAYQDLPDTIKNIDAVTADIVKNKFSTLFTFSGTHYLLSFTSCDQRLQSEIETKRTALEDTLADFQKNSSTISAISSKDFIDSTFTQSYQALTNTNELVSDISDLLLLPCSTSNASLDGYRATLTTVKASLNALYADTSVKRATLVAAKNAANQASKELDLARAGTDPYKLRAENALVSQAKAQVETARLALAKTLIHAPFSGTISDVNLNIGETVAPSQTVISMLAANSFEIKAKIPEMDIIKIHEGEDVDITLDAYGDSVIFPATVTRVNPKSTNEGGVPVYTAIVTFKGEDERIKEGMTANLKIITAHKENVLLIPARYALLHSKGDAEVIIRSNGKNVTQAIAIGSRGDDGTLEVVSGLLDGDVLVPQPTHQSQ